MDGGSFSGFSVCVAGGRGGVLVQAAGGKVTVEKGIEVIVWVMDKTDCWSVRKLQRAKGVEVEEKKHSQPCSKYLQCLQELLQNQEEEK